MTETKLTLDGRIQRFECAGLLMTHRLAIVRFDHPAERRAGGFFFPAGSYTLGLFWSGRRYNCYRIAAPDGGVIVYRFDVVDRVRITTGHVRYRDLLLDVWVTPSGETRVEDEEEVEGARAAGLLPPGAERTIERTRTLLLTRHPRIVAQVERAVAQVTPG